MIHCGDITKINGATVPVVDTIIFGAPCQDLSVAGRRAGMKHSSLGDEETTRSGLFMEAIRIIKEMREKDARSGRSGVDIRPRYAVYENVPGAFSSNKGDDFRIVLEEIAKVNDKDAVIPMPEKGKWTTSGCIVADGWSVAWRVLDAQFWGVPQRRRRIALVADFGGQSAPEILFVRKSLHGDTEPSKSKRQEPSLDASRSLGADDCIGVDVYNTQLTGGKACPLTAGGHTSTGTCPKVMTTAYTLQDREGKAGGGKGALIAKDLSATLRAGFAQTLFQPIYSIENHPNDSRVGINDDGMVQALTSRMGTGGGNVPMVMESKANFIDVELEVAVRKYEVNKELLQECLRDHKGSFTNKEISEALGKPLTLVEHWFRRDNSFAIPDPDIWFDLKELLGIETDEFDQSIMEFEVKGSNYDMRNRIHTGNTVPTLTCGSGNTLHLLPIVTQQCFSKSKRAQNETDYETWVESEKANTLNAFDVGDVRTTEAIVYSVDQGGGKSSVDVREDKAPTLTTTHDGAPAVCYSTNHGSFHTIAEEGIVSTLQATDYKDPPTACYAVDCRNATVDRVNGALQSNSAHSLNGNNVVGVSYGFDQGATRDVGDLFLEEQSKTITNGTCPGHHNGVVIKTHTRYIVRRLTPNECEALQGYPQNWTNIGEYIDSTGKKRQTSDAARYKALGNSIALPPWKWVLKRLCACYERDATMASLFDGIGGFPHIWEQLNGKGTCLWASEIEEFPMAVTKVRIGE